MTQAVATSEGSKVSLQTIPAVHPEAGVHKVGGRWMAATVDDRLHTFEDGEGVSEVGERIIELIDGKRSVGEIVAVLVGEFEVPREVCEADALRFIGDLVEKQVLVCR